MSLGSGGAERQMVTLARLLKLKGHEVTFVCYLKDDFYRHILDIENIPILWIETKYYLERIIQIRKFIRNGRYDAVISFLETPNFLNNISGIGGKSWKIITGERSSKENTFKSLRGKILAWFQRYSDAIVCNSNKAKNMWLNYHPRYSEKLTTIYNIADLPEINTDYTIKEEGKLNITVAASFQYLKNPIYLIHALSLLRNDYEKKIKIKWYGKKDFKGSVYENCYDLIKKYKLENTIELYDESKDIANAMKKSDMVALFSRVEGLPNAICEGMSLGKPIIMTKVSDYEELVDDSNGVICNGDDIESIKNALVISINLSEKTLIDMGKNSKLKALNLFSSNIIVNKWINIIDL